MPPPHPAGRGDLDRSRSSRSSVIDEPDAEAVPPRHRKPVTSRRTGRGAQAGGTVSRAPPMMAALLAPENVARVSQDIEAAYLRLE